MSIHDHAPRNNHPAPTLDLRIRRELLDIGGVDPESGKPILRIVWGQSMEASYFMGTRHLTYRHHVKKERVFIELDLRGKIARVYGPGELLPNKVLGTGVRETDIGIPRWFIEYAQPIDPDEWQHERERQEMAGLPDIGPLPEGAIDYELFGLIAEHETFFDEVHGETHPRCCIKAKYEEGKMCLGRYKEPSMKDIEGVRAEWQKRRAAITNTFRGRASQREIEQRRRDRTETEHAATLRREYWAEEIEQAASHVRKRAAASLRGDNLPDADKFTYHVLPGKRFEDKKGHDAEPTKS